MKKVTFINHSSILIQGNDNIILTDPWYKKPAFGSWLSIPPPIYNPSYFIALAKSNPNFCIVISHGHDDHFDDDFLSLMPEKTNLFIPKFDSIGVRKRLERCGLKNIREFDSNGVSFNGVKYKSYIFKIGYTTLYSIRISNWNSKLIPSCISRLINNFINNMVCAYF